LQYFFNDVVVKPYNFLGLFELDDPEQATALFVVISTAGSLLSSVVSGILSDRGGNEQLCR
jgi:hypothetical protein